MTMTALSLCGKVIWEAIQIRVESSPLKAKQQQTTAKTSLFYLYMHATEFLWRTEDNFAESVFPF